MATSSDSALASARKTLDAAKKLSARVAKEGVTSGGGGSSRAIPVTAGLTGTAQQNEINAQNARWGVQPGTTATYTPIARNADGTYGPSGSSFKLKAGAIMPSDIGIPAVAPGLPAVPQPQDVGDVMAPFGEATATGLEPFGFTYKDGKYVSTGVGGEDTSTNIFLQALNARQAVQDQTPSAQDVFAQLEKDTKVRQYQRDVANLTGQMNAITAERDAAVLALEGQGRGQTTGFIGGEQARINREAAIKALPVQAMLATAQGNLEMANQQLTQLFQIRMADVNSERQFKLGVIDALYQFADKKEQRQYDAIQADIARKDAEVKMNIQKMDDWARMAVETGQPSLVGRINALDPKSPTFQQDFARLTGQIVKPPSTADAGTWSKFDDTRMINNKTGEIRDIGGATSAADQTEALGNLNLVRGILDFSIPGQQNAFATTFGVHGPSYYLPGTMSQGIQAKVKQVTAGLSIDAREKMKGSGAISDFEAKTLAQSVTALESGGMNDIQSYAELARIEGVFANAAGLETTVKITDPKTRQSQYVSATREGVNSAISQGYLVDYVHLSQDPTTGELYENPFDREFNVSQYQ